MTTSLLGPLPQFSQKNSASFKNNPLQFNDELDSLLNDDVQPDHHDTGRITGGFSGKSSILPAGPKLKSGTGKLGSVTRKTSSLKLSKPKSKLIPEAANESDNSLDVSVTEEDKAKIVGSIKNIDDMESNLFHSLNKTQPKIKSLGKSKKSNSSEALLQQQKQPRVTKKVSFEDEEFDEQEQELMREINKGLATSKSIKKTNSPPSLSKPQENATTATTTTKSATKSNLKRLDDDDDDDDDDLFADLLSDSEEEDEKGKHYQTKPKLKLIDSISKTQPASNDNNDNVDNSGVTKSNSKEKAASQEGILMQRKQIPAEGAQDNDDEFDGDDILGLIDTPQKPTTGTKKASRFDELLGRKQPQEENQQPKKDEQSSPNTDNSNVASNTEHTIGTMTMAKEDESSKTDFQFGGYLPSTISSNVSNRKSRGLPQGRGRKGLSDTVTSERPSTAPGKKSVRFSDALDSSGDALRPSSTPVVKGPTKQKEVNQHHPSPTANLEDVQTESKMSTIIPTGVMETSVTPQPNSAFGVTSDTLLVERPPTGNRRKRDVILPLDQQSLGLFESNESTTLLPSREHSAQSKPATPTASKPATPSASKPATPSAHQDVLHPEVFIKNETQSTATAPIMVSTATPALSNDVALQRQLTQQQLQMQQQSLQLQQLSSELATSKMQLEQAKCAGEKSATQVKEKLLQELDVTKNQLKELQVELQEERTTSSKLKVEVSALVNKLRLCENERATAVKQYEDIQQQNRQLSDEHRKEITSSTLAADDFKMKLHRTELERDQLQQTLQLCQQRHSEEIQSMEKSHSNRLATIEEAHQRREQRWKEEQEMETARHAERIQQLEQEKLNSAIAQRKKLESLEISKNNEIEKLQTVHRSSVGDLHREHELEIQHLKTLHDQEMAALKAAFSHTRALTDLTRQVEASSREVSSLQHRVDKAHSLGLTHREETLKCREEQLKANERRLAEQQAENEAERVRLQTLISRMESSLSDQTRQLEQERWKLQQDCVRLNAQQAAFDQDRASFTARIEQERADLQAAKEKFLAEQREIMSKCYEERRAVADEQSKLSSSQKMSKEKELRESERLVKAERTLKLQLERLEQESSRLAEERTKLLEEQETQESHHKVLAEQCKAITDREKEADGRLQQAIEMHEMATKMYQQGQRSLKEAQALKETAESQLANVRSQQAALQKQEKHLTQERLNFVKDKKEQIQETSNSAGTQATATTDVVPDTIDTDDIILPSFDYAIQPQPPTRSHMGNLLDQLDTSIQLRRIAMEAEQDNEYLEEEKNFLASLCNSGRLTLMELESS